MKDDEMKKILEGKHIKGNKAKELAKEITALFKPRHPERLYP